MLVDLDGRDIFEIDQTGNVANRIADQSQDVVRIVGADGTALNEGISFEYGTVDQVDVGNNNVSVLSIKGDQNGEATFEYLADNLSIEFGLTQTGPAGDDAVNYVSTGCLPSREPGSAAIISSLDPNTNVRRHVHSHPSNTPVPSGLDTRDKDIGFTNSASAKFKQSNIMFQIYLPFTKERINYSGGSRREDFPLRRNLPEVIIGR
jgi:hypothetical protein